MEQKKMVSRRKQILIDFGLLPLSGEIVKHREYMDGAPISYVSINLNYVLPEDLPVVIQALQDELARVAEDQEDVRQSIRLSETL
jgi:hypothetical protein